jgi:hypothetical protein
MQNNKWQKVKEKGKLRFSILYGLFFSIVSSGLFILITVFFNQKEINENHCIVLIVLFFLGPIWAVSFWNLMNKRYR